MPTLLKVNLKKLRRLKNSMKKALFVFGLGVLMWSLQVSSFIEKRNQVQASNQEVDRLYTKWLNRAETICGTKVDKFEIVDNELRVQCSANPK